LEKYLKTYMTQNLYR